MVAECGAALYARAMRLVGNQADALDLVQDTYERALRGRAGYQPGTNLRHWLMTILYNLFVDRCRRRAREPRMMALDGHDLPGSDPTADQPLDVVTQEQVAAALADLEPPFRDVCELRLVKNCSYDEIADRLTIPRSTVGTRLLRARTRLRESLMKEMAA